jgi:NAD(P)-dependent dehydrogenase (short-subunit alcohol dehydrogenase family)
MLLPTVNYFSTLYDVRGKRGRLHQRMAGSPTCRVGQPGDIAELAVFLASDRASFITGELIASDGGNGAGYYHRYDRLREQVRDATSQRRGSPTGEA